MPLGIFAGALAMFFVSLSEAQEAFASAGPETNASRALAAAEIAGAASQAVSGGMVLSEFSSSWKLG